MLLTDADGEHTAEWTFAAASDLARTTPKARSPVGWLPALTSRIAGVGTRRDGRYARGMTTKIAVSLPDDLVVAARQAVADGRAASVSAFVAEAIEEHGLYEQLSVLLSEMAAEAGTPTNADHVWARQALGLS